jgi:hypothetical protein
VALAVAVLQTHREEAEVPAVAEMMPGQAAPELRDKAILEVLESIQMVAVAAAVVVQAGQAHLVQVPDLWLARLVGLD